MFGFFSILFWEVDKSYACPLHKTEKVFTWCEKQFRETENTH